MAVRITCINKSGGDHDNPHEAISHLGWVNEVSGNSGKNTRLEMYDWIEDDNGYAYVTDVSANKVKVETAISKKGTKYVRTVADGRETNNLLNLPEC